MNRLNPHSRRRRSPSGDWLILTVVLLLAALARFCALDRLPPGWRDDELIEVDMDSRIAAGWRPLYIEEAEGHEPLYHYVHAGAVALFGPSRLSYRWLGAACGLVAVAMTMSLGKRLFGWRVALLAGVGLAASFWPLMYARLGLRHIGTQPALLLTLYALWRGIDATRNTQYPIPNTQYAPRIAHHPLLWFTLAALGLTAGLYTYFAGRVVPVIVAALAVYLLLLHRKTFQASWTGWVWMGVLTALLFAPLGLYLARRSIEPRLEIVGRPLIELRQGNPLPVIETARGALGMFTFRGDPEWLYNYSGRPVFDWITGAFFYLGVALIVWRWRRVENGFLLIWLLGGLSPAMLSLPAASFGHTMAALPAVYLTLGVGLAEVMQWLAGRAGVGVSIGRILAMAVLALNATLTARDYIISWSQHPSTRFMYHADMADLGRYLNDHPDIRDVAVSTAAEELVLDARSLRLDLTRSPARVRLFDPRHALVLPAGQVTHVALIAAPLPAPHVEQFLLQQAVPVGLGPETARGPAFWLYTAALYPTSLIIPTASHAVSLPVTFGGRLSLIDMQITSHSSPDPVVRVRTVWRVEEHAALPDTLELFAHLVAPDGSLAATGDRLDVLSSALYPGDQFVQWNDLLMPANPQGAFGSAAPGGYQVAVGLYEPGGARWRIDSTSQDRIVADIVLR